MIINREANKEAIVGIELDTYFEFNGIQISSDDLVQRTRAAYLAEGNSIDDVKSVKIYINANERRAYYVINDNEEHKYIEF